MRGGAGHPGGEDVVVGEEDVLGVPVVVEGGGGCGGAGAGAYRRTIRGACYHGGEVGHGSGAEALEGGGGQVDHVLLGGTQAEDGVQEHGEDEAAPAPRAEDLVL